MSQSEIPHTDDLVQQIPKHRHHRSRSKFRKWNKRLKQLVNQRILWLSAISVLAVAIVAVMVLASDATNRVNASVSNLNRVFNSLSTKQAPELTLSDFQRLQFSVKELLSNLTTARRQTIILQLFAPLNADLATTFEAMDIAEQLSLAADDVLTGLEPTLFFLVGGDDNEQVVAQISSGERLVELLRIGRPQFIRAGEQLAEVRSKLDQLDFSKVSPSSLLQIVNLEHYYDQFQTINNFLVSSPEQLVAALGLDVSKTYLILAQNSDELRPSGGYISTYGWMTVRSGHIEDYDYSPTTSTSPNPPDAESPYIVPDWWIRYGQPVYAAWDGSWYADFPATAQMARWYYDNGNNPQSPVDGVIAIDMLGFETILKALGEVTVPLYNVTVSAENFREVIYDIRAYGGAELEHKHFIAALFRQIMSDWQEIGQDREKSARLLGATLQALQQKHVMLNFVDEQLNQTVRWLGWAGEQTPGITHDYLMIADANMGNKSNHSITRQVTYDADIQPDGTIKSRATIVYDYPRSLADKDPAVNPAYHGPLTYSNLLQMFVPLKSVFAGSSVQSDVMGIETNIHMIYATHAEVAYDSSERFQFSYVTPPLIEQTGPYQRYRLLLQKQPGTSGDLVNVQVMLPANAELISTSPPAAASYNLDRPILEYRVELLTDQWIDILYRNGASGS